MKEEIKRVLELLEKGVIAPDEANELIKSLKEADESTTDKEPNVFAEDDRGFDNFECDEEFKKQSAEFSRDIEGKIKGLGDSINKYIDKMQPELYKATKNVAEKVSAAASDLAKKMEENANKVDETVNEPTDEPTSEPTNQPTDEQDK